MAWLTAVAPTMLGKAKRDVLIAASNSAGWAVIIVAPEDHASVDFTDEVLRNWVIIRNRRYPPVGLGGSADLLLRASQQFCSTFTGVQRYIQLSIGKLGAF